MNANRERHLPRRARRWRYLTWRRAVLAGPAFSCLLLISASPAAAAARPTPGGIDDPVGTATWSGWSGWSVKAPEPTPPPSWSPIDRTPPVILATIRSTDASYRTGSAVWVDFTCTDANSGIRWCPLQAPLDTSASGPHHATFVAIDMDGNVAATTVDYVVIDWVPAPMKITPGPLATLC